MRLGILGLATVTVALAAGPLAGQLAVQASDEIDLLPPETLQGWTRTPIPAIDGLKPKQQWRIDAAQHALVCSGDGGHEWLRSDRDFGNFILTVEWRFTPRGADEKRYNSGIGVRLSKWGEIWYQAQTGLTGGYIFGQNFTPEGLLKGFNLQREMKENRVKPAGEWNRYEIRAEDDRLTLSVNGAIVSELTNAGLRRGYIGFEAEGYEIAFRNIRLRPLK